jgi:hypothetical protein
MHVKREAQDLLLFLIWQLTQVALQMTTRHGSSHSVTVFHLKMDQQSLAKISSTVFHVHSQQM